MPDTLLHVVARHAAAHADPAGLALTPVAGLTTIRATAPTGLVHAITKPMVCMVLQGTKHVAMGAQAFSFGAGDSLIRVTPPAAASAHQELVEFESAHQQKRRNQQEHPCRERDRLYVENAAHGRNIHGGDV